MGIKGTAARNKQTLFEHARRARLMLQHFGLPLVITLAPRFGYALCRKARVGRE